jgi:hypothetical protein
LVGNPYPSAIDWDASTGWNNTNIISSIYFRSDGNYGTYIAGHGGLGTNGATNIIPPMQSFWVRVDTQQTTGSLGCDNSVRVHSSQNIYRVGLSSYNNTLHLTATNNTNGLSDDTYIIFDPSATDGFDSQYDAYKMFAVDPAYPQVYTNIAGSGDISINSLSALVSERIIPLGFNASVSGQYTFTAGMVSNFTNNGNTVFLKDLNTGTYQDLSSDSVYQFTSGVTSGLSRFLLYFNKSSGIDEHSTDQIQIFSNNNQVYLKSSDMLNGDATVYDVLGQIIATKHLSGESSAVINLQPVSAVYIVKYTANDITITKRIFINK